MEHAMETTRPEIIVLGGINMDLVMNLDRLPAPGESRRAESYATFPGGKGANQAVACAKLGASVSFVSGLGEDGFAEALRKEMGASGVDMTHVPTKPGTRSGTAMIMVDQRGENLISFAPGAAAALCVEDIEQALEAASPNALFLVQFELGPDLVFPAIRAAKRRGLTVVWNPAPAPSGPIPADVIRCVDVVIPNETETEAMTGQKIQTPADAEEALSILKEQGFARAIITLGSRGVAFSTEGRVEFVPARSVDAIDATAAGDVFVGAFSANWAAGRSLDECVAFANRAAALSTTRAGAMTSIPERSEVETLNHE